MQIIKAPHPALLKVIPECEAPLDNYFLFCEELRKTCAEHKSCVGLAANQVGVELRIFVFCGEVAINPTITARSGEIDSEEGCMSLPGVRATVRRSELVMASYFNEKGKQIKKALTGLESRVYQHELDHLNGKLIADIEIINQQRERNARLVALHKQIVESDPTYRGAVE